MHEELIVSMFVLVDFLKKVLLVDSIGRDLSPLPGVTVHVIRGGKLSDFVAGIEDGSINVSVMDAVLVHAGTNDMARRYDAQYVLAEMGALIRCIRRMNSSIHIVVAGILPRLCDLSASETAVREYNRILVRVCRDRDVMVIRSWNAFTSGKEPKGVKEWLYAGDRLHLSVRGSYVLTQVYRVQFSDRNILQRRQSLNREADERVEREASFGLDQ